ncbi:glutaredoxin family protein [Litoribacillus peritrichatus]|uniref:Glutaredoxin domain-containing protein n=1 Tax=Litoribacillus peritrichatus TaxID=718191 RepID=A0ABP7MKZ7_9GAMM
MKLFRTHVVKNVFRKSVVAVALPVVLFSSSASFAQNDSSAVTSSEVVLFSAVWCGYCDDAKAFLKSNNIHYTNLDLDVSDEYIDRLEAEGGQGIPYLVVGDRKVSGFSDDDYKQILEL